MKHICENCGYNYKEEGLAVDMSATAYWNEKTQKYELKRSLMSIEIKCPNCYSYADEIVNILEG